MFLCTSGAHRPGSPDGSCPHAPDHREITTGIADHPGAMTRSPRSAHGAATGRSCDAGEFRGQLGLGEVDDPDDLPSRGVECVIPLAGVPLVVGDRVVDDPHRRRCRPARPIRSRCPARAACARGWACLLRWRWCSTAHSRLGCGCRSAAPGMRPTRSTATGTRSDLTTRSRNHARS
jgi:hypothetical protein